MTIGHSLLTTIASKDAAIESHASSIQRACPVIRASPAPMVAIKSAKAASAQTMRRKALSNRVVGIVLEFSMPSIVRDANLRGGTHSADYESRSNSPAPDFAYPGGSRWDPLTGPDYWDSTGRLIHPMARPNPAIAQRKSDPSSTQIIVLGRVVACRASLVVISTFFGIVNSPRP
jgi:hypothetical protein